MTSATEAEIFEAASRLKNPAQRAAFLDQECQGDPERRQRLDALLAAHEQTETFLDHSGTDTEGSGASASSEPKSNPACPRCGTELRTLGGRTSCPRCLFDEANSDHSNHEASTHATPPDHIETEDIGDSIGPYKLLEKIGEGGFGVVYMAEQARPMRRRVALKVIKQGMDTKQVIARFEAERQALAMMDDPNIAKVLDAGTTDSGRPYFVMELVKGLPITRFCNERKLNQRQRFDLFLDVCSAVQHAHQKGVIHRDIKPSNVLVTLHGDRALPKIIDFGIAKATHQPLTENTLFTRYDQFIGTPIYMSPEQAALSGLDIDTRSDIYALGVLLYELLSGKPPFDAGTLAKAGYDEMRRIIREDEPPRPSLRLSTMAAEDRTNVARDQGTEPDRVSRLLRGDIDWIVMKAMEKDRNRRYETANALAQDIQRHLANEPVTARPPSAAYRFQKAWRRNKVGYSAGILVVVALVAGLSLAAIGLNRAERAHAKEMAQRHLADTKAQEAEQARLDAEEKADQLAMNLYLSRVGQAYREVEANRPADALALLEACPDALRNWEWRYVWNRCHSIAPPTAVPVTDSLWGMVVSPNGRDLAVIDKDRMRFLERMPNGEILLNRNLEQVGTRPHSGVDQSRRVVAFSPLALG